ncbi:MAG: alpha/beta hydrolase [Promethearchaeota archaeon]|nr:MAG: alpha/beta hydrolase [Candidatus Lokiarchaeota archaeon]
MSKLFDEIEEVYIETNGIKLHTVLIGSGKPLMLLHGFPDFWYGWKDVILGLKDKYKLIVPDMRGYNLSDKPEGIENYTLDILIDDIKGLSEALNLGKFSLAGHDWGGPVAWGVAGKYPELLEKLIIINGPHPIIMRNLIAKDKDQRRASSYVFEFIKPDSANLLMENDFKVLKAIMDMNIETLKDLFVGLKTLEKVSELQERERGLSGFDMEKYVEAWSQSGAIQAGLHYYRASVKDAFTSSWDGTIKVPTLVIHGMNDIALTPKILNGLEDYIKELKIVKIENASHWVMIDAPKEVNSSIKDFIGE